MTSRIKALLLLVVSAICCSAFLFAAKLRQQIPAPVPHELFAIVNEQLAAFRSSDFREAYRHAAIGVQQKFTLPQFEEMVRQSHVEMLQAQRVEFGLVDIEETNAALQVFFVSEDGSVRCFLYDLIREDKSWKIEQVRELTGSHQSELLSGTHA